MLIIFQQTTKGVIIPSSDLQLPSSGSATKPILAEQLKNFGQHIKMYPYYYCSVNTNTHRTLTYVYIIRECTFFDQFLQNKD